MTHAAAFFVALPIGVALVLGADGATARAAAIAYAATVAFMFGASGTYHRVTWSAKARLLMRRVDHAGIYLLIAGSYTPVGLLILHGSWRLVVLAIVWTGAATAVALKLFWDSAPKWFAPVIAIALGWVGVVVLPQVAARIGLTGTMLLLGGGLFYTAGGVIYAVRRPDPAPTVFGYHELFHALVVIAVALQYAAIAFWIVT